MVDVFNTLNGFDFLADKQLRTSGVFNLGSLGGDIAGVSGDAEFDNVVLLLDGDGTSGSTTFTDKSNASHTITTNGNTQVDTAVKKFGTGSIEFDGTGDYLSISDSEYFNMGSGDFTAECWAYFNSLSTTEPFIMGQWSGDLNAGTLNWAIMLSTNTGYVRFITSSNGNGVLFDLSTSTTSFSLSTSTWYHIAAVRNGSSFKIFVDGVERASTTNTSALYNATNAFTIGAESDGQQQAMNGYLDDLRITKGVARYSSSFTPPTSALPTTGTVAGATRPTRKWGGMVGRSLVATTATLWTPDDVTNTAEPSVWLDASTSTGLTTNKGSLSTTVTLGTGAWSSSGTQNGLTTAINSAAGTVVPISFTGTAVASVAMLYKWDSAGASRAYGTTFSGSGANDYVFMGGNGSAVLHSFGNADSHNWDHVREDGVEYATTHNTAVAWSTRTTDWMLHVFVLDGTRTATINRWGYERTYATRHFTGEIAEVMAFPGKLSQSECEQVEGYLAHKWGLASLLPSAHSYKSAAPTSAGVSSTNVSTAGVLSLPELLQARYIKAPDGLTAATAATSAEQILLDYPSSGDGIYWIDDSGTPKQVYCDMTNDGGGWMLYASFATNTNVTSGSYPAWLKNALSRSDMTTNASTYGLTDNSPYGKDGTTYWNSNLNAQFNDNAFYGPGYVFWDYLSGGVTGITMNNWFGPSSVDQLRVHWGRSASTYTTNPAANKIYTNNTLRAQISSSSVGSSWRSDVVTFDPSGAAGTPLFLITEDQGVNDVNGIAAIWMR